MQIDSTASSIVMNGSEARLFIWGVQYDSKCYTGKVRSLSFLFQDFEQYLHFCKYVKYYMMPVGGLIYTYYP